MLDSFGIVKPVEGENDLETAKFVTKCLDLPLHIVCFHIVANLRVVDAHREGVNLHRSLPVYEHLSKIVFDSQNAKYASEKVLSIVDRMESDQVGSQDAFQNGPTPLCWE